jgi:hypothetical protein
LVGVSYLPFQNTKPLFLRIWRDFNQDGISQSEELLTLSDLNIASINLQKKRQYQFGRHGQRVFIRTNPCGQPFCLVLVIKNTKNRVKRLAARLFLILM